MDSVEHTEGTEAPPSPEALRRYYQRLVLLENEVSDRLAAARRLLMLLAVLRVGFVGVVCVVGVVPHVGEWILGPVLSIYVILEALTFANPMSNKPPDARPFWSRLLDNTYYLIRRIISRNRT